MGGEKVRGGCPYVTWRLLDSGLFSATFHWSNGFESEVRCVENWAFLNVILILRGQVQVPDYSLWLQVWGSSVWVQPEKHDISGPLASELCRA